MKVIHKKLVKGCKLCEENKKEFYLVDYKGKFTIACDELDEFDYEVGKITKKQLINEVEWRKERANWYGVPVYIGKDKELNKLFK